MRRPMPHALTLQTNLETWRTRRRWKRLTRTPKTSNQSEKSVFQTLEMETKYIVLVYQRNSSHAIDENSLCGVTMKHLLLGKRQRMGGSEVKQKLYKLKKAIYQ